MGSEQRQHPRIDADLPVFVQGGEETHAGNLRNVSATGAAIEFSAELGKSSAAFDIGDTVEMQHPGPAAVRGTVVRSYAGGIAMHFEASDGDLLERVAAIARDMRDRGSGF